MKVCLSLFPTSWRRNAETSCNEISSAVRKYTKKGSQLCLFHRCKIEKSRCRYSLISPGHYVNAKANLHLPTRIFFKNWSTLFQNYMSRITGNNYYSLFRNGELDWKAEHFIDASLKATELLIILSQLAPLIAHYGNEANQECGRTVLSNWTTWLSLFITEIQLWKGKEWISWLYLIGSDDQNTTQFYLCWQKKTYSYSVSGFGLLRFLYPPATTTLYRIPKHDYVVSDLLIWL